MKSLPHELPTRWQASTQGENCLRTASRAASDMTEAGSFGGSRLLRTIFIHGSGFKRHRSRMSGTLVTLAASANFHPFDQLLRILPHCDRHQFRGKALHSLIVQYNSLLSPCSTSFRSKGLQSPEAVSQSLASLYVAPVFVARLAFFGIEAQSFASVFSKTRERDMALNEKARRRTTTTTTRGHIVVVPLPAQGHVTPAWQLAQQLLALGFRITFVNTDHNHEQFMKSRSSAKAMAMEPPDKGIEFVSMSDGLPEDFASVCNLQEFNRATLSMGPILEALLLTLRPPTITCIIRDIRMSAVHAVAKKLGIPVVGLATPSAVSKHCIFNLPVLLSSRLLPLPPPPPGCTPSFNVSSRILSAPKSPAEATARQTLVTPHISGVSPTLQVEDLPNQILADLDDHFLKIHLDIQNPLLPDCECILFNSFHDLEGEVLDVMDFNARVFAVGPLVLSGAVTGSTLREEDPGVLSWLDTQPPNSVLFVSFGSLATASIMQMQELASGLELSNASFVWVIRADTIVAEEMAEFETWFPKFTLRIQDRGLLVTWAPQAAVLSHPAVAAFLTHCGWNSVIESIAYGVPMLAWPRFADQPTNAHYVVHVWKVGMQLEVREGLIAKEEIERKVRKMLAKEGLDPEMDAMRANSRKLEGAARKAVAKGGSSDAAMAKFVELLERWATPARSNS